MLSIPTRRSCHRRFLAFLIGIVVAAMFIQHDWILPTSLPPQKEALLSDWKRRTTEHNQATIPVTLRRQRKQRPEQQRMQNVSAVSDRNSIATSFHNRRTTSSSSFSSTTSAALSPSQNVGNQRKNHAPWLPPRLHTCFLQPNLTVTFAIPRRHLIIAGAQKSGTSALYFILRRHPHLLATKSVESHFFDWQFPYSPKQIQRWMQERNLPKVHTDYFHCAVRYEYFTQYFDGELLWDSHLKNKTIITFEKTPSYLFLDKVPQRIHDILSPDNLVSTKIIVSLRHPVERAYSQFHSDRIFAQVPWNVTFEYYLNKELAIMRRFGLTKAPNVPIHMGGGAKLDDDKFIPIDEYDSALFDIPPRVIQSSKSTASSSSSKWLDQAHWNVYRNTFQNNYFQRSMYAVQLRRWMKYFTLQESLLVLPYERFLDHPQDVVQDIVHFCQLPQPDYFSNPRLNASTEFKSVYYHHGGQKEPLALLTRQYMERFLEPYNRDLAQLLNDTKHDWETIWKQRTPSKVATPVENHMLFTSNVRHPGVINNAPVAKSKL